MRNEIYWPKVPTGCLHLINFLSKSDNSFIISRRFHTKNVIIQTILTAYDKQNLTFVSGLDKDFDQWVFYPLIFNLMSTLFHI